VYPWLLQYFNCGALAVSQRIALNVGESSPAPAVPQGNNLILNKPKKGFLVFPVVLCSSCSQRVIPRLCRLPRCWNISPTTSPVCCAPTICSSCSPHNTLFFAELFQGMTQWALRRVGWRAFSLSVAPGASDGSCESLQELRVFALSFHHHT